jgi:predicted phage terminase large subunit-like protein
MNKVTNDQWIPAPWLQYCSLRIARGIVRGGARIIISAPPRHGKTELVSVGTSAWVLENFPRKNIILAAYGADLAEQYGRKVRDLIIDRKDILDARIRADVSRVNAFLTETDGYMFSVGLGGAITGRGAHVLLIDDYIKEIKEALSPAHRDYIYDWFRTTARTRLEPGASIIIIATRWHSDDLIGRLVKLFPGRWENIVFPAIAEEGDPLNAIIGRKPGEALFPDRYDIKSLMETKEELGSVYFDALYQQKPVDESKRLADGSWLKLSAEIPHPSRLRSIRMWDLAATQGGGDFTVGSLCGYARDTDMFFIMNIVRRQLSPHSVEDLVRQTAISDGTGTEIGIEQEPGSAGLALVEHYARNVVPEFRVTPFPVTKNKIVRAQPLLAGAEAGKVILAIASWNKEYIDEFNEFPGDFDDQIDTTSAAFTKLTGKKFFTASWGRNLPSDNTKKSLGGAQKASFSLGRRAASWGRSNYNV